MTTDLGTDFDCVTDLRPDLGLVSGQTTLLQNLARMLGTPRGMVLGSPNRGYDLREAIGRSTGSEQSVQQAVEQECLKDERVRDARATVVLTGETKAVAIAITENDGTDFEFTLAIDDVTGELLLKDT